MYVEFTAFIANILMVLILSRPNVRRKSILKNAPKPRGNFGRPICGTPFLTTAVGSVLDDSGTNYGEMECAGDEFDLDNKKG